MNKTLRLLLLIGLAAFIYASCSKDKDFLDVPDSFERNKNPFSVEAVPQEGRDTLIFFRIKGNDSIKTQFYPTDTTLKFKVGDSIILEARAKNGYTFINWVRDGNGVSNNPIYGFKLDSLDIDKSTHFVKHHYEARFGLDYALQVIPPIDSIIPKELIAIMGPHLHFGDNPPLLYKMRHDTILGFYAKGPTLLDYYAVDSTADFCRPYFIIDPNTGQDGLPTQKQNWDYFLFHDQHRCIAQIDYKCLYYDETFVINGENINICVYDKANNYDSVFIMGNSKEFTAFFHQYRDRVFYVPENSPIPIPNNYPNPGSHEAMIISGKISDDDTGVEDVYFGIQFLDYDNPTDAGISFSKIGDIIIYHYDFLPFSYWKPDN